MYHSLPHDKQPVILQLLPELRAGGVERGTLEISAAIQQAGWQSIVASAGGEMAHQLSHQGAKHIELPLNTKHPWHIYKNSWAIEKIIRDYQVDIVHARSRAPAWSGYLAAKRTRTRFMTTFHGTYNIQNNWKHKYNSVMVKGDRVIAISNFIAEHIAENYEIDPSKLRTIHRGVDVERFQASKVMGVRVAQLAHDWHLPDEDVPLILMPGRITRWKGQDILLKALAKLPHRDFFCVILGDDAGHPGYREELEELIVKLNLCGYARIAPNIGSMAEAYALSRVVVAPSLEPEAFGRVPVEAQAMGKPVIATNHGGFCETIVNGETGWLVAPGDVNALADKLQTVLSMNESARVAWALRSRQHACDFYSSTLMQHKTINVYSDLLWSEHVQPYDVR